MHALKKLGAFPERASEYSDRLERYRKEFPEDHADRMMPPLITESRPKMSGRVSGCPVDCQWFYPSSYLPDMPAFLMPITKAEEPAPAPPLVNFASSEGHRMPIDNTHPT